MHKNNELYVCRVCGAEQPEAIWGDNGELLTYYICNCCGLNLAMRFRPALLNKSDFG